MSTCGLDIHYSEELTHLAASHKDPDGLLRLVREDVRSLGLPDDNCRIEQGSGGRTLVVQCRWDDGIVVSALARARAVVDMSLLATTGRARP